MFKEAEEFIERVRGENRQGKRETIDEIERFQKELNINFPHKLRGIYLTLPVIGLVTQYHCSDPQVDWKYYAMEWMSINSMLSEIEETSTGEHFFNKGFLPIGMDILGGGDYYYIDTKVESLPVYQCYHDDYSYEKIADSVVDIFKHSIID